MKQKVIAVIKTYWTALWLITASVALLSMSAYAAYNGGAGRVKRVVTTKAGVTSHFSSNYLSLVENVQSTLPSYRTIIVPQGANPENLRICNYSQGYREGYPDYKILYTLEAVLYDENGSAYTASTFPSTNTLSEYYITRMNSDGTETNFSFAIDVNGHYSVLIDKEKKNVNTEIDLQLPGNRSSEDEFALHFEKKQDGSFLTNVYMKVVATPTLESNETNTLLNPVGAIINMEYAANKIDTNWTGTISEAANSANPSAYDGFNYVVSGNGEGTITIIWNPEIVGINKYYKENNKSKNSSGVLTNALVAQSGNVASNTEVASLVNDTSKNNWKYIRFAVSSEIENDIEPLDRYVFQMYKIGNTTDTLSWSELYDVLGSDAAIQFKFEKSSGN